MLRARPKDDEDGGGDGGGGGGGDTRDTDRRVTLEDMRAAVRARLAADDATPDGTLIPPLAEPVFAFFPMCTAPAAPVAADTVDEGVVLPRAAVLAWRTRHALPTRPWDATYTDVVDASGAAVPLPRIVPFTEPHFYVDDACQARGAAAENNFVAAAAARGWTPRNVVEWHTANVQRHVDVMLRHADGRELWVDVKSARAVRRRGALQNAYMMLELHNSGFLRGAADALAVEVWHDGMAGSASSDTRCKGAVFMLLDRVKLADWAATCTDFTAPLVAFPEQALRRMYRRPGKAVELMTLVPTDAVYAVAGAGMWQVEEGEKGEECKDKDM